MVIKASKIHFHNKTLNICHDPSSHVDIPLRIMHKKSCMGLPKRQPYIPIAIFLSPLYFLNITIDLGATTVFLEIYGSAFFFLLRFSERKAKSKGIVIGIYHHFPASIGWQIQSRIEDFDSQYIDQIYPNILPLSSICSIIKTYQAFCCNSIIRMLHAWPACIDRSGIPQEKRIHLICNG